MKSIATKKTTHTTTLETPAHRKAGHRVSQLQLITWIQSVKFAKQRRPRQSTTRQLKDLLGHAHIDTTMIYLHLARPSALVAFSPMDTLYNHCK